MITMKAIICKFQLEAVHADPNAADDFQRGKHRHVFHFKVTLNAAEDEEKILNPIRLRNLCLEQIALNIPGSLGPFDFDERTTLDIADWLASALFDSFGSRGVRVDVLEDGENGAVVTYGM
jgi:hypothetical protein